MKNASPTEALLVQRRLPASPDKIFRALTEPARLAKWFAPSGEMKTIVHSLDLRVGGAYRIDMVNPDGSAHKLHGVYREIRENELLVFTWKWEDSDEESIVRIELQPMKGGCELILTHEKLLTPESRAHHLEGWEACLGRLPEAA